jgi:hypothetical protein
MMHIWKKFEEFLAGYDCVFSREKGPVAVNWTEQRSPADQSRNSSSKADRSFEIQMSRSMGSIERKSQQTTAA